MAAHPPNDARTALIPLKDILPVDEQDGVFQALDGDPAMLWAADKEALAALSQHSAIRVQVELEAIDGVLEPCIYFDWGDGFSEETRSRLARVSGRLYSATGHSNAGRLRRIRLDPSSTACTFRVAALAVTGVGANASPPPKLGLVRRMIRRVVRRLPAGAQGLLNGGKDALLDPKSGISRLGARLSVIAGANPWREAYTHGFQVAQNVRSPYFAAPPLEPPRRAAASATVVAFYLPQFHPIPENDLWWGKGFTEWTNVSKAQPQFVGHYQPRLPGELGFYDLRLPEVHQAQARLARRMGIDAFCFHYYWFAGRRILEGPLDRFVNDESISLPFALCWANENWTRRWDGLEQDLLLAQVHSPEDDLAVIADLMRYMRHERYLRVDGKPLLLIYRPDAMPEPANSLKRWRQAAREAGLGELHILCTDAFGFSDYAGHGFDGIVEFPPHAISAGEMTQRVARLNPGFKGRVYDYGEIVSIKEAELGEAEDPRRYPGLMTAWDNEARKPGAGHVFNGANPELFHRWALAALRSSRRINTDGAPLVFVNAWNEWAEGAYLEPDRWFGHGFGQGLRAALEADAPRISAGDPLIIGAWKHERNSQAIFLLHIYYPELIEEFARLLEDGLKQLDCAISFPDTWTPQEVERLANAFPTAILLPCENRGRDVKPFLELLPKLDERGYTLFCKLHSKRSPHLATGESDRLDLLGGLASAAAVNTALRLFEADPRLGLLATEASRTRLGEHGVLANNRENLGYLTSLLSLSWDEETPFPAGTMFWGRIAAFDKLLRLKIGELPFEVEMGRIDGALAHAFERAMDAIATAAGYSTRYTL